MSLKVFVGFMSLIATISLPLQSNAQASSVAPKNTNTNSFLSDWGVALHLGQLHLDPVAAKRLRFNENATTLSFAGEKSWNDYNLSLSTGLNIMLYGDKVGFSQNTTKGVMKSSTSGGSFFIQAGPQIRLGDDTMKVFLHGGYNQIISNSRNITECYNCYSESVKLKSGAYIATGIGYTIKNIDCGIQYVKYASGDFKDNIGLSVAVHF